MSVNCLAQLYGVSKKYGERQAVDHVELSIQAGSVTGLLGANGSGKSTLLRILASLTSPTKGRVELFGKPLSSYSTNDKKRLVGYVHQEPMLDGELTALETLHYFSALCGLDAQEKKRRLPKLVDHIGLSGILKQRIATLSGGQRQRVHIAITLLQEPTLLLLDEPMTGLDPSFQQELWQKLRQWVGPEQAIVVATHHLDDAEPYLDHAAILANGKLLATGTPSALKQQYARSRAIIKLSKNAVLSKDQIEQISQLPSVNMAIVKENDLHIRFDQDAPNTQIVLQELRKAGIEFREVQEVFPSLKEAYFGATGSLMDAAPIKKQGGGNKRGGRRQLHA